MTDQMHDLDLHVEDAETVTVIEAAEGAAVDPPRMRTTFADVVTRAGERRPIVPASLRTKAGRHAMFTWALAMVTYTAAYRVTRAPKYLALAAWWTPRGLWQAIYRPLHWATAEEGNWSLRQNAANTNDPHTWMQLDRHRQKQTTWRWPVLGFCVLVLAGVIAYVWFSVPYGAWLVCSVTFVTLARVGRPADRPILDRVYTGNRFIRLTAELTRSALVATGKVKEPADVTFPTEIARDEGGRGHVAVVALPPGVIATDIIDRREQLASGFRLPMDQVWPETVRGEHPGVLQIYVSDRPVSAMKQPPWPLLTEGTTDYFEPFPYGADVRLRPVSWALAERNSLFGGVPGSGKSLAARDVLLGAVLDPLVIPVVSELKGSGDHDCFEPLCPSGMYVSGADDGAIARTLDIIEWLYGECETRAPLVAKYAKQGMNSVKKVNRAMAQHDPRLRPVVALFDEIQEFMISKHGIKGDGAPMLLSTVKRARALGIHVIVATQRFDKDSLPKALSSLVTNRAALAVPAQPETDMILGTSAYRTGARPTAFVPGEDSGWMVRAGFSAGYETVRAAYVDDDQAAAVCARALQLRQGATLDVDRPKVSVRNLLDDVRRVWPLGEPALWSERIVPLLRELDANLYGDLTVEVFGAQMTAAGVPTGDIGRRIDGKPTTRKGVRIEALDAALEGREITGR